MKLKQVSLVKKKKKQPAKKTPKPPPKALQEKTRMSLGILSFVGQGYFIMENTLTYSLRKYTYFEIQWAI